MPKNYKNKIRQLWYLNRTISFESYMIQMRVGNQKTTINKKVRAISTNIRARSHQIRHPWSMRED